MPNSPSVISCYEMGGAEIPVQDQESSGSGRLLSKIYHRFLKDRCSSHQIDPEGCYFCMGGRVAGLI